MGDHLELSSVGTLEDDENDFESNVLYAPNNFRPTCNGYCIRGPRIKELDVQLLMMFIYILTLVGFGLIGGLLLFKYFPLLVIMPLCYVAADFWCFLMVSCSDPGISPPSSQLYIPRAPSERVCKVCNIKQEPETRHCHLCNACIHQLDHHCGITGTCIGARNRIHFSFLFFFYSTSFFTMLIGLIFAGVCTSVANQESFNGSFSAGIETCAKILGFVELALFLFAFGSYVLLVFSCFGSSFEDSRMLRFYRIVCRNPTARDGLVTVDVETKPLCSSLFHYPPRHYNN